MKKLVFTLGLCMLVSASFGQKKAVSEALKVAKDARGSFAEARSTIKGALEHPETKDDANTWFTAGKIEELQYDKEMTKLILMQKADSSLMYNAIIDMYPYYKKAYELDQLPDAKGKVKPKFSKNISAIMSTCLPSYINSGLYFYENSNFEKALQSFNRLVEISESPMLSTKENWDYKSDSNYIFATFFAAFAAFNMDNHDLTVEMANRALKIDYKRLDMFKILSAEYINSNDTVNWEKTLEEALAIYPTEDEFLLNLINIYMVTDRYEKALSYINSALKLKPEEALLYYAAGTIYESSMDLDKAEENYKKAVEFDDEIADIQSGMGRIYYNRAVSLLDTANSLTDTKKFEEEKSKAYDLFRKAMPFYEKAHKLEPSHSQSINALQNIYYQLNMGDKLEELEKGL